MPTEKVAQFVKIKDEFDPPQQNTSLPNKNDKIAVRFTAKSVEK